MQLIGNALNGRYFAEIMRRADCDDLEAIRAAVAYTSKPDALIELANKRSVPLRLYTLLDGDRFPPVNVLNRFIKLTKASNQLFVTRHFFHPKIYWFEGVGAYIGSANLTDAGWSSNLECGTWFDANDIDEHGFESQLEHMFGEISKRCTPATIKHIEAIEAIKNEQKELASQRQNFDRLVAKVLDALVPGQDSPIDPTKTGEAKQRFTIEWDAALTDLHKLVRLARERPSPSWVASDVHPAFIQDQATEHWYHKNIRTVNQDQIEVLHRQNRNRIDSALEEVFQSWTNLDHSDHWLHWVNVAPARISQRLSRDRLRNLSREDIHIIVQNSHAMRMTAKHVRKGVFRIPSNYDISLEERCKLFADLLADSRNAAGRDLGEILEYVIWGDDQTKSCAERIWNAVHDPAWGLPYIGEHSYGELVGYARPDEFPPRNNREQKTLRALGFDYRSG